jgi:hypothetical protein
MELTIGRLKIRGGKILESKNEKVKIKNGSGALRTGGYFLFYLGPS